MLANVGAATARAKPTPAQLRQRLAAQQKQLDTLIVQYGKRRDTFNKARRAEQRARDRAQHAQQQFEQARRGIQELAELRYQAPEPSVSMLGQSDPTAILGQAALLQQLSDQRTARLSGFATIRDELARAKDDAAERTKDSSAALAEVGRDKEKAEKLIASIKDQLDAVVAPTSRRSDGTWVPELPTGTDNITERMRIVRGQVEQDFPGLSHGIGCYRSTQDGGEHPLGRACDFMLSSGGAMPSADQVELGNQIAEWAIKNAPRMAIKYVIYRQRIWQTATGSWKAMSDRGGVTANHFDHVHISVY
ncbi:hypothetical protein J5X84_26550 [Streptosporangiaceae bacterium NEAU-GS5]|nr:hypothetical protein [Streptosporangiaceae bacterium NEAU-GS5]